MGQAGHTEGAARVLPRESRAQVGTEGHPPAGRAHLHAQLLVLLLQAPELLLQGVVLEVLLQGQRGLVPAQPGDSRDGLSSAGRVGMPTLTPARSPSSQASTATELCGVGPTATKGGQGCGHCYPRDGDGSCPAHRSSCAPGERQDRGSHSRRGGGGGGLALLRGGGVEVQEVIPHGHLVAQLCNLERQKCFRTRPKGPQQPPGGHTGGQSPDPCPDAVTSSLASSSCSSRSSLRSVRLRFCFSRDCPMRAANSRSRSFCRGQVCLSWDSSLPHSSPSPVSPGCHQPSRRWDLQPTSSSRLVTASISW